MVSNQTHRLNRSFVAAQADHRAGHRQEQGVEFFFSVVARDVGT